MTDSSESKADPAPAPEVVEPETAATDHTRLGRRSISRRMWRSLVMLVAVLVISGAVTSFLLLQVVQIVRQLIEVEDPLERAVLEMEINAVEATQALYNYVAAPEARYLEKFQDSNADFRKFSQTFNSLLQGDAMTVEGAAVLDLQQTYESLGEEIIALVNLQAEGLDIFRGTAVELDALIDEGLQGALRKGRAGYAAKLHAALDMEVNIGEALGAIESYIIYRDPGQLEKLQDSVDDFARFVADYRKTRLSADEGQVLDRIVRDFSASVTLGQALLTQTDQLRDALSRYRDHLEHFDDVIDNRIQAFVRDRKLSAYSITENSSWIALIVILAMSVGVLVIAGLSTFVLTRSIVRAFWSLVSGIDQFAQGNFGHRIDLKTEDELGALGDTFNEMVEQRRQAVAALDEKNRLLAELSTKLSRYLSPQVYDSIFSGEQDVVISTSRKKLTVFFSDIKDFTSTTENLQPEDLTNLLNDYLTEMTNIALEYGATVDKYIGDAMLLFFGDPTTKGVQEDALTCVRMAIAMQQRMAVLRERWRDLGYERPFHMRIGINTGYCNVGNFGSEVRMDYTIIGGEVNLAARLEGACDPDGVMLAHETWSLVRDEIDSEAREPVIAKGIAAPVKCYAVLGISGDRVEDVERYLQSETEDMQFRIDLHSLDANGRRRAAEELERHAARLRDVADSVDDKGTLI